MRCVTYRTNEISKKTSNVPKGGTTSQQKVRVHEVWLMTVWDMADIRNPDQICQMLRSRLLQASRPSLQAPNNVFLRKYRRSEIICQLIYHWLSWSLCCLLSEKLQKQPSTRFLQVLFKVSMFLPWLRGTWNTPQLGKQLPNSQKLKPSM